MLTVNVVRAIKQAKLANIIFYIRTSILPWGHGPNPPRLLTGAFELLQSLFNPAKKKVPTPAATKEQIESAEKAVREAERKDRIERSKQRSDLDGQP